MGALDEYSRFVTVAIAAEELGLKNSCTIFTTRRFVKHYKKTDPGKKNGRFNIGVFLREEYLTNAVKERFFLLVEYIRYEKGMKYKEIAEAANIRVSALYSMSASTLKCANAILSLSADKEMAKVIDGFDDYYNYREETTLEVCNKYIDATTKAKRKNLEN